MTTSEKIPMHSPLSGRLLLFLGPDRRVLWMDRGGVETMYNGQDDALQADGADAGFLARHAHLYRNWIVDAAFETQIPHYGDHTILLDGREQTYSIKAFPEFTPDGEFRGVIEIIDENAPIDSAPVEVVGQTVDMVLDLTIFGVILYDPEADTIIRANRRIAQLTGYPFSELVGLPGRALFGATGVVLLREHFARMEKSGQGMLWGQYITIRNKDGADERFYCSLRVIPETPKKDAKPILCISIESGASETGMSLGEFLPNARFVMEAIRDGLWEFDMQKQATRYSRSLAQVFGEEGATAAGMPLAKWLELMHPDDIDQVFRNWQLLLDEGRPYRVQYRVRALDGGWHWMLSNIHCVLTGPGGKPSRILGIHLDITDAMHTEQNLADAEERLRMVFDNVGIGMAVMDRDGVVEKANPALEAMLKRDRDELAGRRFSDFAHPDDMDELDHMLQRLRRGGRREVMYEKRLINQAGKELWVDLTATLSGGLHDNDAFIVLMVEDITEQRKAKSKLQYEATHDVMTGAWNRGVILERLGQHINLALRHHQPMAFCICDLDHFKNINDVHGHQAGDAVIVEFVRILMLACRDTDVVGRYGGEEFAIVFPNTSVSGAAAAMERARRQLEKAVFTDNSGGRFAVTATFGLSSAVPGATVKSVIAQADGALYQGKESGRNQVVVHRP